MEGVILEFLGLIYDTASDQIKAYLICVARFLLAVLGSVAIFVIAWANDWAVLLKLASGLLGVELVLFLFLIMPVLLFARVLAKSDTVRNTWREITAALFWLLNVVVLFWVVPFWQTPNVIPLVLILLVMLAIGYTRFNVGVNPRWAVLRAGIILSLLVLFAFVPGIKTAFANTLLVLNRTLEHKSTDWAQAPESINYGLENIDRLPFFNAVSGKPLIYYALHGDCQYELFAGPGRDPDTGEELHPADKNTKSQIKTCLLAKQATAEATAKEKERATTTSLETTTTTTEPEVESVAVFGQPGVLVSTSSTSSTIAATTTTATSTTTTTHRPIIRRQGQPAAEPRHSSGLQIVAEETTVSVVLAEPLSSRSAKPEQPFQTRLQGDLLDEESRLAVETGTLVQGYVVECRRSGRVKGTARLALALASLQHGQDQIKMETDTLTFEASPDIKGDLIKILLGGGAGAAGGAVLGGGKGGAIGGGIGAATAILLRGKEVDLPAGTVLSFVLSKPLLIYPQ